MKLDLIFLTALLLAVDPIPAQGNFLYQTKPRYTIGRPGGTVSFLGKAGVPITACQFSYPPSWRTFDLSLGTSSKSTHEHEYYGTGLKNGECGIKIKHIVNGNYGTIKSRIKVDGNSEWKLSTSTLQIAGNITQLHRFHFDKTNTNQEPENITTARTNNNATFRVKPVESAHQSLHRRFPRTTNEKGNEEIEKTFKLLKEGDERITLGDHTDIVLVLGNTGAGKSTFTQYIAGDNDKLISVEKGDDTGEYIIEDNNRISNAHINSKTIFPELVIDSKTNTHFFDCPGFSDTRSTSYDIAATYFTKRILDHGKKVKLLFLVNYSSVRHGIDRQDFMNLILNICNLVKDVEKFKDSIALIVTKVENQYRNKGRDLVADDKVIGNIATFLKNVKISLLERIQTNSEPKRPIYLNAIKFIDILLVKREEKFIKIGIFRRPDEPGPVSKIDLLQIGKNPIRAILNEDTMFTLKVDGDFGYTISDRSKNDVNRMIEHINDVVVSCAADISKQIKKHYRDKAEQSEDVMKLHEDFTTGTYVFLQLTSEISELKTPSDFLKKITKSIHSLEINIKKESLSNILDHNSYFVFFESVIGKGLKVRSLEWINPIKDVVAIINDLKYWYSFLVDLYTILSGYEIQKDRSLYNVDNIDDWGLVGKKQGIKITSENLSQFLDKIRNLNIHDFDQIKVSCVDEQKLKVLNHVLDLTLKQVFIQTCTTPDSLSVKGEIVKLSDVSSLTCPQNLKSIEIVASNVVIIDQDLDKVGLKLKIAIMSPKWHIQGARKIDLSGAPNNVSHDTNKGNKGMYPGSNGENGLPGLPGGTAGSFLGIGKNFINGEALTITANGGVGGLGQDGGDGSNGVDGTNPIFPPGKKKWHSESELSYRYEHIRDTRDSWCSIEKVCDDKNFKVYGTPGTVGGNGGNGGKGGIGGHEGVIKIIELEQSSGISVSMRKGEDGPGGKGGEAGIGGQNGNTVVATLREETVVVAWVRLSKKGNFWQVHRSTPGDRVHSGVNGVPDNNSVGMLQPEAPVNYQVLSPSINIFRVYIREQLNDSFKKHPITQILSDLDKT